MAKLQTVRQRAALPARREPHWHALATGQHIGYRRSDDGGTWIARAYDAATQTRQYHAIGDLGHLPANEQFSAAVKAARDWFEHIGKGGRSESLTVRQACARYGIHLEKKKGAGAAADALARFRRFVDSDPIAAIELHKLTARHVEQWRERMEAIPAARPKRGPNCRTDAPPPPRRPRSASSLNRDMVALRAALNLAKRDGYATTDLAWSRPLEPVQGAGGRRTCYLTREQRRALVDALQDDLGAFVHGLCLLPLRPGALAALKVADFDSRAGTLAVHHDKAGAGRTLLLPPPARTLLTAQARGKLPNAPLFARWDGRAWDKDAWKKPLRAAAAVAGLPPEATAYTMRHSTITDLVAGGLDLLTVAQLSGTSVAMIESNYGHLQRERARDALAGLAL